MSKAGESRHRLPTRIDEAMVLQMIVLVRHEDRENDPPPELMQVIHGLAGNLPDHIGDIRVEAALRHPASPVRFWLKS